MNIKSYIKKIANFFKINKVFFIILFINLIPNPSYIPGQPFFAPSIGTVILVDILIIAILMHGLYIVIPSALSENKMAHIIGEVCRRIRNIFIYIVYVVMILKALLYVLLIALVLWYTYILPFLRNF